jgi:hypothetical protein
MAREMELYGTPFGVYIRRVTVYLSEKGLLDWIKLAPVTTT